MLSITETEASAECLRELPPSLHAKKNKRKPSMKKIVLIILLVLVLCVLTAAQVITHILLKQNFSRGEYSKYTTNYRYNHYQADYHRTNVSFKSGKNTLQGYIYGEDNNKALLVFAHGIGGGHENYLNTITWFVDRGWRVFAYDATGSCTSEGEGTMGLPQSALDLDSALTYIENDENLSKLPKFLMGHSWGGYAVTAVLNFNHDVKAVASVAGYAYPMEMVEEFAARLIGDISVMVRPFMWTDCFAAFGNNVNLSAVDGINKSNVPVFVIHGKEDKMIHYDGASIISKQSQITNPNVKYLTIDGKYCGHSNIFQSDEANDYLAALDKQYDRLAESNGGEISESAEKELFENADKKTTNQNNEYMLGEIHSFFESKLQ